MHQKTFRSRGALRSPFSPFAAAAAALAVGLTSWGAPLAYASQIIAPSIGVPDTAMSGATVATPLTPTAAAFSNPAGIMNLEPGSMSAAFGLPVGHSRVDATIPTGNYNTTSDFVAYAPEGGSVFAADYGVRWGFAIYGSLGSVFDSDAEPSVRVEHDFLSTQSISNVALMAAVPAGERLSIGVALAGIYGQAKLRYFQNDQFAYTVRGPGVQAIFGLRYRVTDNIALGASYRTPGMVWADGDDALPDGNKQDVDLDLELPAQVFLGINADVTERLSAGLYGRWTDASRFSHSTFRFEDTPQANVNFIRAASDEWRIGAGAAYRATDTLTLRGGVGHADSIVPDTWVSPLLIDSNEWKISAGFSWEISGWTVDCTVGHSPTGDREVSASEAVIFPGRYTIGGQIYMIGLRTTL